MWPKSFHCSNQTEMWRACHGVSLLSRCQILASAELSGCIWQHQWQSMPRSRCHYSATVRGDAAVCYLTSVSHLRWPSSAILVPDTPEARVRQTEPLFGVVRETPAVSPIVSPDSAYKSRPAEPDTTKVPNEIGVYKTPAEVCQTEDRRQDTLRISPIVRHRNRTCHESKLEVSDDREEADNAFPHRSSRNARSSESGKVRYEPNREEVCKKLHWTRIGYSRSSTKFVIGHWNRGFAAEAACSET